SPPRGPVRSPGPPTALAPASLGLLRRQFDHEAGALLPVRPVLDPDRSTVQPDVLGDEREPQPDPVDAAPVASGRPAVEPEEDRLAVVGRHAGAVVLDGDEDGAPALAQLDPGRALAVLGGV